jgi:hypothetical protein
VEGVDDHDMLCPCLHGDPVPESINVNPEFLQCGVDRPSGNHCLDRPQVTAKELMQWPGEPHFNWFSGC